MFASTMKSHALIALLACVSTSGLGCALDGSDEIGESTGASYILTSKAWTMQGGVATIPVCWETGGFATKKSWVRSIVESSYENQPFFHVNFTGWGTCVSSSSGIRIQIADTTSNNGPHVKALGRGLNGMSNGMMLNFTFNNWSQGCQNTERDCIEQIAMHEFGHALSLAHEQNRDDKPSACTDSPQGTDGDVFVGNFDTNSMMAYCNPTWNNGGILSEGDVAGLARLYGAGGDVFVAVSDGWSFSSGGARHDWFCLPGEVCDTGDFNGDGIDDLIAFTRGTLGDVYVSLGTGSGFSGTAWKWHDAFAFGSELPQVGDFNGDGRDDIAVFTRGSTGDVFVALSTGSAFSGTGWKWHGSFAFGSELPDIGDFNGDGRDDIVVFTRGSSADVFVAISTGSAFSGSGWKWHDYFAVGNETPMVGDINGDGRDDIVTFAKGKSGFVFAATSNGSTFVGSGILWSTGICLQNDTCGIGDITGDGRADLLGFKRQ